MTLQRTATLIEVAPRDGFQPIGPFIPTDDKVAGVATAHAAGLRRTRRLPDAASAGLGAA